MPLTNSFKAYVIGPEIEDAQKRLADPDYWGDTGHWVERAIGEIEAAMASVPVLNDTLLSAWLSAVDAAVVASHERFRISEDDPDGYGSATFHQCLARIRAVRDEAG